jgi:hypothetical protein
MPRPFAPLLRIGCLALCLIAGAVAANAQGYPMQPPPPAPYEVAPPPPPASRAYMVWRPGFWRWNGRAYAWVPGRYVRAPHPGAAWIPGHWVARRHRWVWAPGHWS